MSSIVSSKVRITLPAVHRILGLLPGTTVQFELREGGVLLRRGGQARHPVNQFFGCLKLEAPVDVLMEQLRGPELLRRTARRGGVAKR